VDILLKDVNIDDYASIIIVGGQPYFWNNARVLDMVRTLDKAKKPIGAICISGCIPAQAGIMKGRKQTMFADPEGIADIQKNGGIYTGEDVTVDGNVVTANGPIPAQKFAEELVKLLK
jgi:protease I